MGLMSPLKLYVLLGMSIVAVALASLVSRVGIIFPLQAWGGFIGMGVGAFIFMIAKTAPVKLFGAGVFAAGGFFVLGNVAGLPLSIAWTLGYYSSLGFLLLVPPLYALKEGVNEPQ